MRRSTSRKQVSGMSQRLGRIFEKPAYGWCCVALTGSDCKEAIQIDKIIGYGSKEDSPFQLFNGKHFDTTVGSDWLEYCISNDLRIE